MSLRETACCRWHLLPIGKKHTSYPVGDNFKLAETPEDTSVAHKHRKDTMLLFALRNVDTGMWLAKGRNDSEPIMVFSDSEVQSGAVIASSCLWVAKSVGGCLSNGQLTAAIGAPFIAAAFLPLFVLEAPVALITLGVVGSVGLAAGTTSAIVGGIVSAFQKLSLCDPGEVALIMINAVRHVDDKYKVFTQVTLLLCTSSENTSEKQIMPLLHNEILKLIFGPNFQRGSNHRIERGIKIVVEKFRQLLQSTSSEDDVRNVVETIFYLLANFFSNVSEKEIRQLFEQLRACEYKIDDNGVNAAKLMRLVETPLKDTLAPASKEKMICDLIDGIVGLLDGNDVPQILF
jgi:hypothetical protein